MARESLEFDVLIVGAGPSGLAAAIRLAQLSQDQHLNLSICVLEKGAAVGAHILSGAVLDPKALTELLPNWPTSGAPLTTLVNQEQFMFLSANNSWRLPMPAPLRNKGNYIISLDALCRWLAMQAELLGVQIFPGFAATQFLYDAQGAVCGVGTGDKGLDKHGQPTPQFQAGINLHAKYTLLAEGCRGSLTKRLMEKFNLYPSLQPQSYALGIKELWEIPAVQHKPGFVLHSIGWPLTTKTYGGSFLYHLDNQRVAVGFVVGLDYANPYLDPYEELQRFKTHALLRDTFKNAKRLEYGARALNEGGWQSLPQLSFAGGLLIGDCAGFLNVPRLKGIHTAMKSGMIAAETLLAHWGKEKNLTGYEEAIKDSWIGAELYKARNIRPAFQWGLWGGLAYGALDTYLFKGKAPWTLKLSKPDYACLKPAKLYQPIVYPKHDGKLTFDKLASVYISNTHQQENQPCHLLLKNSTTPITVNLDTYASPESRYCPAGVYEIIDSSTPHPRLHINAANCIHCKTCDIKDPTQNITWVPPEGGDGPGYTDM